MPIVWKTSFEEPLINLIKAGQIGNSKKMVDYITNFYDLSIKQGLPNPPGTPAGPLISGNTQAFKAALNAYFKIRALRQQVTSIQTYIKSIKSILQQIRDAAKELAKHKLDYRDSLIKQQQIINKINKVSKSPGLENNQKLAKFQRELVLYQEKQANAIKYIEAIKDLVKNGIKPKIVVIKQKLKALIKRILVSQLQDTKLKSTLALAKLIKNTIKEFVDKKKNYINDIKQFNAQIKEVNRNLRAVTTKVDKKNAATLIKSIRGVVTTLDSKALQSHGATIISIVDSQPDEFISAEGKANTRAMVTKIMRLKERVADTKLHIQNELKQTLKDRILKLIRTFKPNFQPGLSKIFEIKRDIQEVKDAIAYIKTAIKNHTLVALIVSRLLRELRKITASNSERYSPSRAMAELLNKYRPNLGNRYLQISDIRTAKAFIAGNLNIFLAQKDLLLEIRNKIKTKFLSDIKKKLKGKLFNPEEFIFNRFLQLALTGYWTAGTMPNLGFVIFPGIVTLPAQMKSSEAVENFIRSLSKAFQAHALTITGTYTTSTTPPVVLPWIGYF